MRKPVIGVLSLYDQEKNSIWMLPDYLDGIRDAGGLPVMLPLTMEEEEFGQLKDMFDGYLFTGGQDVNPALYGEEKREVCGNVCSIRDTAETLVFRQAMEEDRPIFGICRGIQFINVMMGGTLYQDLPSERQSPVNHHMDAPYDRVGHMVDLIPDTLLSDLWKRNRAGVNSMHHQGIRTLGKGLRVTAQADDGLIEGIYSPEKRFLLAVQWHPEHLFRVDTKERLLFEAFVKACSKSE